MTRAMVRLVVTLSLFLAMVLALQRPLQASAGEQGGPVGLAPPLLATQERPRSAARTELFFGTSKPDGSIVTDEEFATFLDAVVTPRFPDGVTILVGFSQFVAQGGVHVKEKSFVLILLYPVETAAESDRRIGEVRHLYQEQFQQASVTRVDALSGFRVSF